MFGIPLQRVEEIEELAASVWKNAGQGILPLRTRQILTAHGIFRVEVDGLDVEAEFDMRSRRDGFKLKIRKDDGTVLRYVQRMRFTEAHEMGHVYLHNDVPIVHREDYRTRIQAVRRGDIELARQENEADTFAGALLMPQEVFLRDIGEIGQAFRHYARKYGVTDETLTVRVGRLRGDLVVSGYAWGNTGVIAKMVPSLALERSDPDTALRAWRCNEIVPGYIYSKMPARLIDDLKRRMRSLGLSDLATIDTTFPDVSLSEIVTGLSNFYSGEVYVLGCDFDGRKIYFEMTLS